MLMLSTALFSEATIGQSHVYLINNTPCFYEYRDWKNSQRPEHQKPTGPGCDVVAEVVDRVQRERVESYPLTDPDPGPRDENERNIDCLHEYRLWKSTDKGATPFLEALGTYPFFKIQGRTECIEAKAADERIALEDAARAKRNSAEAERQAKENQRLESAQAKKDAAKREARAAQLRKPGVKIGMTTDEVLTHTSWGEPTRKNTTTTAREVREQWVYGANNYLYFVNGRLTAVQN
ncbi:MAG: hypothetical protein V4706_01805 [Pseudomonadota bacterium]